MVPHHSPPQEDAAGPPAGEAADPSTAAVEANAAVPDSARWSVRAQVRRVAAACLISVAGYLIIWPDWFHIQNGLDPFFYTGMSLNLSDSIDQGAAIALLPGPMDYLSSGDVVRAASRT